ncbi:copper amine oxidase N-terminal domain-containing protein [Bernardetia sp.]|uniref:copper amine oxidase N-terminal domain-containing protein n=1 Tax=Bernardetia sp. TaxID=1937974 RepID=UPI0025BD399D|nr:copper amine oxidase N-terminal domain-containing protein [Bernardetia sp.]
MKFIKLNLSYIAFLLIIAVGFTSCQEDILEQVQELEQAAPSIDLGSSTHNNKHKEEIHTAASSTVRVLVNGNPLVWPNYKANPVNNNGYVMVYMRTIFERLGYSIQWIQSDPNRGGLSSVIATKPNRTIQIWVGDRWAKVNGSWVQASVAPYNNQGYVMVHSRFVAENSGAPTEWDQQTQSVQIYYYDELDYGFYFFDSQPGNNPTADAVGCQKYVSGVYNPFFDPTKPTIIYVHGNAPGSVASGSRENFLLSDGGLNVQSHNIWKAQGWNVAIFYWIQFADEGILNSAPPAGVETKIYDHTAHNGMRWRKSDGSLTTAGAPNASVRVLFAQKYLEIFNSNYSGAEIRVVGNSLGGNLTMAGLLRLERMGAPRMPSRVTLMDPFWTPLHDNTVTIGENQVTTAELAGLSAEVLANRGIAIEYFRTSLLGAGGLSSRVGRQAAVAHFGASFLGNNHFSKHTVPVRQYFHSRGVAAPLEVSRSNVFAPWVTTGNQAMSAATSNARIRQMMGANNHWNQVAGRGTASMVDDQYERRNGLW